MIDTEHTVDRTSSQGRLISSFMLKVDNPGTYGEVSSPHDPEQRSDGRRRDHYAHNPSPIGYTRRFTLHLSNLYPLFGRRSGVTLRTDLPPSMTRTTTLTLTQGSHPGDSSVLSPGPPLCASSVVSSVASPVTCRMVGIPRVYRVVYIQQGRVYPPW